MVQEEIADYLAESKNWRQSLAERREKLIQYQKDLLGIASKRLSKEDLQDLEHYQNAFYIQLINIHDVKKDLKYYEAAVHHHDEKIQERHDAFRDEYNNLIHVLDELDTEFDGFKKRPH